MLLSKCHKALKTRETEKIFKDCSANTNAKDMFYSSKITLQKIFSNSFSSKLRFLSVAIAIQVKDILVYKSIRQNIISSAITFISEIHSVWISFLALLNCS